MMWPDTNIETVCVTYSLAQMSSASKTAGFIYIFQWVL